MREQRGYWEGVGRLGVMGEGLMREDDGNGGFGEVGVGVARWMWVGGGSCGCEEVGVGLGRWVWMWREVRVL